MTDVKTSVKGDPSGNGWRYYATLACYELPYVTDYFGPVATKAEARKLARQEAKRIADSVPRPATRAESIIGEAIACHGDAFRAEVERVQAITLADVASMTERRADSRAIAGAQSMADSCAIILGAWDARLICHRSRDMITALNIACRVMGVPAHVRTAAAVDWQESAGQ